MTTVATAIRDAIVDRLGTLPGYAKVRKTPVPQLQSTDLPAISVFVLTETLTPDGDDNVLEPSFDSVATIAIAVMHGFADPTVLDGSMDNDVDLIEAKILTDQTFVTFDPANRLFEAITQITRRRLYPQSGEAYLAEVRLEMTFRTRVSYPPVVPDDFNTLSITTRPLGHPDAPGIEMIFDETT